MMICVVDDDAYLLRALRRLLLAVGFVVQTFGSAEEFLLATRSAQPDCLVLDVHLGTLSGFDLHDRLLASGVSIPTVFISGHDDAATRERARSAGAAAYLAKPIEEHSLISAIEAALNAG